MLLEGNLKGIQHVGIPVSDLDASKTFYMNFGFQEVMNAEIPGEDDAIKVAMLEKDGLTIEFYQLTGAELQEIKTRRDGHIDHIALNVIDIGKAYAEITAAGLEIVEEHAPVFLPFWENGVKFFTVRGPDGEKIEFNQIMS